MPRQYLHSWLISQLPILPLLLHFIGEFIFAAGGAESEFIEARVVEATTAAGALVNFIGAGWRSEAGKHFHLVINSITIFPMIAPAAIANSMNHAMVKVPTSFVPP